MIVIPGHYEAILYNPDTDTVTFQCKVCHARWESGISLTQWLSGDVKYDYEVTPEGKQKGGE